MKTQEKKVLRFHEGRGGQFNNAGYLTFVSFEKIQQCNKFDDYMIKVDDRDNLLLNDNEDINYIDGSGNELEYLANENGTGYIHEDTIYDSTYFELEDELTEKQQSAIVRAINEGNFDEDELIEILKKYYADCLIELNRIL